MEQQPVLMEVGDVEDDEEAAPVFHMDQVEAEFAIAQVDEMAEQHAIQDEASVESNRRFIRLERTVTDGLFADLKAEEKMLGGAARRAAQAVGRKAPEALEKAARFVRKHPEEVYRCAKNTPRMQ
ncbi:hypothetical protein D1007_28282 [Hordeum vulgare]|nr:hypothetical protein D1007_28282 [Hordeum vulgare]